MQKNIMLIFLCIIILIGLIYYYLPEKKLPPGTVIDKIIVLKSKRRMEVYAHDVKIKTYTISLGREPVGAKTREGDNRTPEGTYTLFNRNPLSNYHKNFGISYPSPEDLKQNNINPGGDIKIHGLPNGQGFIGKLHRFRDWTAGCIAVTNDEIDELYEHVQLGSPIIIKP